MDGDYKTPPPPGTGEGLLARSRRAMKHDAVQLDPAQRVISGQAMIAFLLGKGLDVIAFSLDAIHLHLLGRFADGQVTRPIGHAKVNAYYRLRDAGRRGKVWGRSCGVRPIVDRDHQVRVYNYIREHERVGAWVWTHEEGIYWE